MDSQARLDAVSILSVFLTGIISTSQIADLGLPSYVLWWISVGLLTLRAMEEVYKRRVEAEALRTPPPAPEEHAP